MPPQVTYSDKLLQGLEVGRVHYATITRHRSFVRHSARAPSTSKSRARLSIRACSASCGLVPVGKSARPRAESDNFRSISSAYRPGTPRMSRRGSISRVADVIVARVWKMLWCSRSRIKKPRTYKPWNLDRDKDVLTLYPPRPGRTLGGTFVMKLRESFRRVRGIEISRPVDIRNFLNKSLCRSVTWRYMPMVVTREQCSGDGDYSLLKGAFRGDVGCSKCAGERKRVLYLNLLQGAFWMVNEMSLDRSGRVLQK